MNHTKQGFHYKTTRNKLDQAVRSRIFQFKSCFCILSEENAIQWSILSRVWASVGAVFPCKYVFSNIESNEGKTNRNVKQRFSGTPAPICSFQGAGKEISLGACFAVVPNDFIFRVTASYLFYHLWWISVERIFWCERNFFLL